MTFEEWVKKWNIGPGMNDGRLMSSPKNYTGFDGTVGEGWIPLLDALVYGLISLGWDRQLDQVKEKFGGLRFYVRNGTTEQMDQLIRDAENKSFTVCERCGNPGHPREGGWIKTLCDPCAARRHVEVEDA